MTRTLADLFQVALGGLFSRKVRTVLLLLGPTIGVAAIVAAVGLTDSAKGDLKRKVAQLGTNLIEVGAASSFGGDQPTLPADSVDRALTVRTVEKVSAVVELSDIGVTPLEEAKEQYETVPVPVMAADTALPDTLEVSLVSGRWLDPFDEEELTRAAVIGVGLAREIEYLPGETRTVELDGLAYGVVGVLGNVELAPTLDNAVFISFSAAEHDFLDDDVEPNKLYVRSVEGTEQVTADALRTAIALGGSQEVGTEIKSEALELAAQSDRQLQLIVVAMGLLAIIVGGIGIANVMSISVIQRSSEIGIRRAVGHSRSKIAAQFLLESLFVGILGGLVGAALGIGVVYLVSSIAHWVVVVAYSRIPIWMSLALLVSVGAGLYPSIKAARLEPLETLRLG